MGRKVIIRHDAEGYAAFRRGLIENGTIQAPEPEALEAILHQLDKRIDRAGKSIHIPGVKARVEADQAKLDGAKKAAKKATGLPGVWLTTPRRRGKLSHRLTHELGPGLQLSPQKTRRPDAKRLLEIPWLPLHIDTVRLLQPSVWVSAQPPPPQTPLFRW